MALTALVSHVPVVSILIALIIGGILGWITLLITEWLGAPHRLAVALAVLVFVVVVFGAW